MLAQLKSVAKALVGFLGVAIEIGNRVLALNGVIPVSLSLDISIFIAVATPIAAYFAPYAPSPKTIRRRAAAKKAAARKAQ